MGIVRLRAAIQTFRAEKSILMRLAAICAAILTLAAGGALAQETPASLAARVSQAMARSAR
jgi:hypothetical protein